MSPQKMGKQLCNAARDGKKSEVQRLLDEEVAFVNFKGVGGSTPLHHAACNGHSEICSLLLERGADIKAKDEDGWTPLHHAAVIGHSKICFLLMERGADIKAKTKRGATPLHFAACYGRMEVCSLLLERGADIEAKDESGQTPADMARGKGKGDTVTFLDNWKASLTVALEDVSVPALSVILENLSFLSLVEPFQKNGLTGRAINRIESYRDVMDIDKSNIGTVVAKTFFEDHVVKWQKAGRIPRDLLEPNKVTTPSSSGKKSSSVGYIDGTRGIMLVRTASLGRLLDRMDMTSEDILNDIWLQNGNIYSLLSLDEFMEATWEELPGLMYAVISYQWTQNWHSIVKFLLFSKTKVRADWMWIDCTCLDQMDPNKMATISRSDEIYLNAKEYHLIEIGSLTRGWVLFELSSVSLVPSVHISTQDPAGKDVIKKHLSSTGSRFKVEADRDFVRKKIVGRYGSVEIIKIVNTIL